MIEPLVYPLILLKQFLVYYQKENHLQFTVHCALFQMQYLERNTLLSLSWETNTLVDETIYKHQLE